MSNSKNILNDYVCLSPFEYIDIQDKHDFVCCPSWCPTNIRRDKGIDWHSSPAIEIRKSVLDGTYSHCSHDICPSINLLKNTGEKPHNFLTKKEFAEKYNIEKPEDVYRFDSGPEEVLFGWDRSCNLKCPSCRVNLIANDPENSEQHSEKVRLMKLVEKRLGPNLRKILVTGSGDPFYSNLYRDWLINFNKDMYPKLEEIQVITNGKMLTEKMWSKLNAAPYIKLIEISIDAGTKETYENITRINGKWDLLLDNLRFLNTLTTVDKIIVSMVVSELNYKEMHTFYKLMSTIFTNFQKHLHINFRQHVYWGTGKYTEHEVEKMQVFKKGHPEYLDFINEVKKIDGKPNSSHNFNHLLNENN